MGEGIYEYLTCGNLPQDIKLVHNSRLFMQELNNTHNRACNSNEDLYSR